VKSVKFSTRVTQFCAYWGARKYSTSREITGADIYAPPTALSAVRNALDAAFPDLAALPVPIDLGVLASRRKIRNISFENVDGDGEIKRLTSGDYAVVVNKAHSQTRQRFTIAHEIAHTLFFEAFGEEQLTASRYFCGSSRDPEEERLCDYAAAEMLLPSRQVDAYAQKYRITAASIVGLSQRFRTSLHASARKLLTMSPLKSIACYWDKSADNFVCLWCESSGQATLNEDVFISPKDPTFKFFNSGAHFRGRYWLSLGGPLDRYFIDAFVFQGSRARALTVISLDNTAELFYRNNTREIEIKQASLF
jgi:Zn-dependent peptidase ImmA (M78 family)